MHVKSTSGTTLQPNMDNMVGDERNQGKAPGNDSTFRFVLIFNLWAVIRLHVLAIQQCLH